MAAKFRFYSVEHPKEKTLVNFIFTEHDKDCLKCFLTDFNISAIMPYQLATLKNTIKSLNSLAPLNKPLIGTVEEVNNEVIIISMAYIDKKSQEYKVFEENNKRNKKLITCVRQYAYKIQQDYVSVWEQVIYPVDSTRDNFSLFDHLFDNIHLIKENGLIDLLKQLTFEESDNKTKFQMISNCGVNRMKELIDFVSNETSIKPFIMLESPPNYIIQSSNNQLFLEVLVKRGKDNNINIVLNL